MTHFEDYLFNKLLEDLDTRKEERPPEKIMQKQKNRAIAHYEAVLKKGSKATKEERKIAELFFGKGPGWNTSSPRGMYP